MNRSIKGYAAGVLAAALCAVPLLSASCAGSARARPEDAASPGQSEVRRDAARTAVAEAMSLSIAGDIAGAMASVQAALDSARDMAGLAGALEAKAWALLFSGSREAALSALAESASTGAPRGPGRAVLEFRLTAADGLEAARHRVAGFLADPRGEERAALAIGVMLGDMDLRDVRIESPEAADELAGYLAGYSLSPAVPAATAPADGPVIVVSEPETVGADEATVAIARLACRDALARRGRFRVVDAESRKAAFEELELSLSDATAGERDKAVCGLYSADFVASGSVVKTDSGWLVAYSLSSAGDGHIVASDFSVAGDHAAIMAAAGRFAEALDPLAGPVR